MTIIHFCADLSDLNGMANVARRLVDEERRAGDASQLTNDLAQLTAADSLDVLHVHGTWLPVLWRAARLAKAKGARLVCHPHGNYDPLRLRQNWWKRLKKFAAGPWEHAMLCRADAVQATCPAEAEWIRAYHPAAKIEITDLKRFFKLAGRQDCRPHKPLHVLFAGRAEDPLKGARYLCRAVASLPSNEISLRIVSDHHGAEFEADWEWCDVLCLPTLSENFGLVIAEALERGKRVITTDGAPAWDPEVFPCDRLVYLRGFRGSSAAERIRLLSLHLLQGLSADF